jgi:ABC-2 type transport system permease protein
MFGVLFRNEMLKMFKRLAFWVTFIIFSFINLMNFGESFFRGVADPNRAFALPGVWQDIISENAEINFVFGGVLLVLLIANEFQWRTSRQNVIDGLSKDQWFYGKLLLVPVTGILFVGVRILIGTVFGMLGTDFATLSGSVIGSVQWTALGAVYLAFLGFGSWALFASLAIRNTGPAMAVFLAYVAFIEDLIAGGLVRLSKQLEPIVQFFPMNTFKQLNRWIQFDPVAFEQAVKRAVENQRPPPEIWSLPTLFGATFTWIAVFVAVSLLWYRQRDL